MLTECWHSGPLREGQFCTACERTCSYCPAPAVITSAIGLADDYSEPNELGQRQYIEPRPEPRCEECHAGFVRSARRMERLAAEGWV